MKHHLPLMERLGILGMSSDESDTENRLAKVYRILLKSSRNPELTAFLHTIDIITRGLRVMSATPGNNPRLRLISSHVSTTQKPVTQLPINMYRTEWYDSLTDMEREYLFADPKPYDCSHKLQIRQCVTFLPSSL